MAQLGNAQVVNLVIGASEEGAREEGASGEGASRGSRDDHL